MKCSIVIATRNKAQILKRTLDSIFTQNVPFRYEVIVVDDGSSDNTREVCEQEDVEYFRLENSIYRNPSVARNVGYRAAIGDIIIAQSDDVIHHTMNAIQILCEELQDGEFLIATVYNYLVDKQEVSHLYSGNKRKRPFFFLGSVSRKDLYAVGGNDEDFIAPGYDDDWFAICLTHGLGLSVRFVDNVVGYHQDHIRLPGIDGLMFPSKMIYERKMGEKIFISSGGPWEYSDSIDAIMIVPCKNRLSFLKQALPTMLNQKTSFTYRIAVVDYGCPQNTFDYCISLGNDKLIAIKVLDEVDGFSHSRSRNCGVTNTNSDIVVFMDSDVMLHDDWLESAVKPIMDGKVICTSPEHNMPLYWKGLSAIKRDVFMQAGGFDENLIGWGYEDYDLFDRVSKLGPICNSLGASHINILSHSNELRFLYQNDLKDYELSDTRNKNRVINRIHLNPNGFGKSNIIKYIGNKICNVQL